MSFCEKEFDELIRSIDCTTKIGVRDRAILGLVYDSCTPVNALLKTTIKNIKRVRVFNRRKLIRYPKGISFNETSCAFTHRSYSWFDRYLKVSNHNSNNASLPIFKSAKGKTDVFSEKQLNSRNAKHMLDRRCDAAGINKTSFAKIRKAGVIKKALDGKYLEEICISSGYSISRSVERILVSEVIEVRRHPIARIITPGQILFPNALLQKYFNKYGHNG